MSDPFFEQRRVGGLWCGEVLERLSDYVDDELPADASAAMEAHLEGCANCARFGASFSGVVAALRDRGAPIAGPSPDFLDALRRRLG